MKHLSLYENFKKDCYHKISDHLHDIFSGVRDENIIVAIDQNDHYLMFVFHKEDQFKYSDIKDTISHLDSYLTDNGYIFSYVWVNGNRASYKFDLLDFISDDMSIRSLDLFFEW